MSHSLAYTLPTEADKTELLQKITQAQQLLYQVDRSVDTVLEQVFTQEEQTALREFCQQQKLFLDQKHLADSLEQVAEYLSVIPVLTITLAVEPTRSLVQSLSTVLHNQLQQTVSLKFELDPSIVAGAQFEFQGKIQSLTMSTMLEKVLA